MNNLRKSLLFILAFLIAQPGYAQQATIVGPIAPCSAFGTTTGTCVQGPGVLGAATATSINFGGTTLQTYSSGTWTPGISFGGGTTGITYTAQNGQYTKIGNIVTVSAQIILSSKGSSTGNALITGLPYTTSATASGAFATSVETGSVTLTALPRVGTYFTGSATTLDIYTVTIADLQTQLTNVAFSNTSSIYFSITYLATTQ